jgi:hypothetical protein
VQWINDGSADSVSAQAYCADYGTPHSPEKARGPADSQPMPKGRRYGRPFFLPPSFTEVPRETARKGV